MYVYQKMFILLSNIESTMHISIALLSLVCTILCTNSTQLVHQHTAISSNSSSNSSPSNSPSNSTSLSSPESNELPPPDSQPPRDLQWTILHDGTVTHTGENILTRNYSFAINNYHQCSTLAPNRTSFVVIIESFIENFHRRQNIRDTWAQNILQGFANYRVFFLVGLTPKAEVQQRLDYENKMYEDIVQINVYEDFNNLTYKSINMLYWYIKYCSQATMLFKTDDDIYLHIPSIIELFQTHNDSLICHKNKSRRILRNLHDIKHFIHNVKNLDSPEMSKQIQNKFTKYLISPSLLPGRYYPEYCSGFGYSMNYQIASKLFQSSQLIPYIGIEDMFITGLSRQKANINIENNVNYRLKPLIHPLEAKCAFDHGRITSNEVSIDEMKNIWSNVNSAGYYCKLFRT